MGPEGTAQSESLFTAWGPGKDRGEGKTPFPMSCGPPFLSPFFPNMTPFRNGLEVKGQRGPVPCKLLRAPQSLACAAWQHPNSGRGWTVTCGSLQVLRGEVGHVYCLRTQLATIFTETLTMMLFLTKGESC